MICATKLHAWGSRLLLPAFQTDNILLRKQWIYKTGLDGNPLLMGFILCNGEKFKLCILNHNTFRKVPLNGKLTYNEGFGKYLDICDPIVLKCYTSKGPLYIKMNSTRSTLRSKRNICGILMSSYNST